MSRSGRSGVPLFCIGELHRKVFPMSCSRLQDIHDATKPSAEGTSIYRSSLLSRLLLLSAPTPYIPRLSSSFGMWSSSKLFEQQGVRSEVAIDTHQQELPNPTTTQESMMEFSSESSLIQVTVGEDGIAMLKINRPEKRNALSQKTIDNLVSAIAM